MSPYYFNEREECQSLALFQNAVSPALCSLGGDRNGCLHVGMNITVIGVRSSRVERHLEGLILCQVGGGAEGIGITGHGMRCI